jgi:hypothetical protein
MKTTRLIVCAMSLLGGATSASAESGWTDYAMVSVLSAVR